MTPCEPRCDTPSTGWPGDVWVCPVCTTSYGAVSDDDKTIEWQPVELTEAEVAAALTGLHQQKVDRMIEWAREHVTPTPTEPQLSFLRAFLLNNPMAR